MLIRRQLTDDKIENDPYAEWNAFVDLLAIENYADLSELQRKAHLTFWYDAEVQNGGHFQYFENRGTDLVPETIDALVSLGAKQHAEVLRQAFVRALASEWGANTSVEDFVKGALVGEFSDLDSKFYDCHSKIADVLESHLTKNKDQYLDIVSGPK